MPCHAMQSPTGTTLFRRLVLLDMLAHTRLPECADLSRLILPSSANRTGERQVRRFFYCDLEEGVDVSRCLPMFAVNLPRVKVVGPRGEGGRFGSERARPT